MRSTLAITLGLLFVLSCSVPPRKGFEAEFLQGELTSGIPPGWRLRGPVPAALPQGIDVYLDGGVKRTGHFSASLVALDATSREFASLEQDVLADPFRGRRVRFSGYIKTNSVYGWTGLVMRVDSEDKQSIAGDNMEDRRVDGTTDWTRYEVVLDVDASAAVISIGIVLYGEGQAWLDDCTLEVVGRNVKTTDQYPQSFKRRTTIPGGLITEPINLDFDDPMFGG